MRLACVLAYFIVFFHSLYVFIGSLVVKMQNYGRIADLGPLYTCIDETLTQLSIFSTILHSFVKTLSGKNVTSPPR